MEGKGGFKSVDSVCAVEIRNADDLLRVIASRFVISLRLKNLKVGNKSRETASDLGTS